MDLSLKFSIIYSIIATVIILYISLKYQEKNIDNEVRAMKVSEALTNARRILKEKGYEVVAIFVQGSQNYNLDEYTDSYMSNVDLKAIVLPSLDDIILNRAPVSKTIVLENDEHIEVKDIRVMFQTFKKSNLSYLELLYTKYNWINEKYKDEVTRLIDRRDTIAAFNENQFLKCVVGMAHEKEKALCHPYPATAAKIEKWGYDGKQLSHCVRLKYLLTRWLDGEGLERAYDATDFRTELMMLKRNELSLDEAKALCKKTVNELDELKANFKERELNLEGEEILTEVLYDIMKKWIKESVRYRF